MVSFSILLAILAIFYFISTGVAQLKEKQWWQTATIYQIYPRSFKDNNGDGIGDLKGIIEKLPYLKEIGVTATWLSPVFTSPMADFGYDISNFYEIDPIFGTMEDFDELMKVANEIGIKIILDFVPNHSSDECEWFQKSIAGDPEYKDFYVWHPGKIVDGVRQPPTNWLSVFRGPMWTWNEQRQAFYLHQFHSKQPDINFRNSKAAEAIKEILRFWFRKGVSGFRIDSISHLYEVEADVNGNYPDEPRNTWNNDPESYDYLDHIYTKDLSETTQYIYDLRAVVDEMTNEMGGDELIIMTESYSDISFVTKHFGNGTHKGAHMPFNFQLIGGLHINSDAYHYKELLNRWLDNLPAGETSNWVMGNHDKSRIASRLGENRIDTINYLLASLPGCAITYNGEEIGMVNSQISWEETVDPQACQTNVNIYEYFSRDPERNPFQWNAETYAGFSNSKPWLPIAINLETANVKKERGIPRSHLNIYKSLLKLRHEKTFIHGDLEIETPNTDILILKRSLENYPTYITILNINSNLHIIDMKNIWTNLPDTLKYVIVCGRSNKRMGDFATTSAIFVMPNESIILRT